MSECDRVQVQGWRWVLSAAAINLLLAGMAVMLLLSGCAAGKAYEKGPDGRMQERLVFGVDAGKLAEGATATIGSLTDPGTLAALAGVGVPVVGIAGALIGKWRGERKGWDEAKQDAHEAAKQKDAAWDEATARTLLSTGVANRQTPNTGFGDKANGEAV